MPAWLPRPACPRTADRKSTRLNSSHLVISYAVFCLKKKKITLLHNGRALDSHSPFGHTIPAANYNRPLMQRVASPITSASAITAATTLDVHFQPTFTH